MSLNFYEILAKKMMPLRIFIHVKVENKQPSIYFCGHDGGRWEHHGHSSLLFCERKYMFHYCVHGTCTFG